MHHKHYVASTILYGIVCALGVGAVVVSAKQANWVLLIVSILIVLVALDNFFCGHRARMHGHKVKGHYVVPQFHKP